MSEILGTAFDRHRPVPVPFASAAAPLGDAALDEAIQEALAFCRDTLDMRFPNMIDRLPVDCRTPLYWFDLLHGCRNIAECAAALQPLRRHFDSLAIGAAPHSIEQFALVQAVLHAAPQVADLPVTGWVKRGFCTMFGHMARPKERWESYFDAAGWRFLDMAQIATLRRFPAGQHDWEVSGLARSWLLKVPPPAWPRLLWDIGTRIGGFAPLMRIHLNSWRRNPLMVLELEAQRSYFRAAQSLAMQPQIKGLMAYSWFYSPLLRQVSPHLAWLRDFFAAAGATLVEMEPAPPDYGFMIGSARRRALFERGAFRPRLTLVLWARADMLEWAARHPELADPS